MLKPEYFNGKSEIVEEYYRNLEDYLMNDIAKFLLNAGELGGKADRELFVLQQMGLSNKEITERLAKISDMSKKEVKNILKDSAMTSFSNDKAVLDRFNAGEIGPLNNTVIKDVMEAEWLKTSGELDNLTRTTMAKYNSDVIDMLNQAEIRVASGNDSYTSAVCDILDQYAKGGMVISYPSGAMRTLEAAVRCAVVTSMNQTAAQVTNQYIVEGGIEYVLISAHTGARHSDKGGLYSHDEWQGKAYKIRGSEPGFPNLLESTGYDIDPETGEGTVVNPAGLHGYNCRHSHQPWDKDLENPWIKPDGTPMVDPQESLKKYEQQQTQRGMERSIRSTKRELMMKQAEIDNLPDGIEKDKAKADYDRLAYKLREKNQKYNTFCEDHNLAKQADRIKAAGFTSKEARKANGRATAYNNGSNTIQIPNGTQEYKKLDLTDESFSTVREGEIMTAHKLENYDVYLSDKASLKPREMHEIYNNLKEAQKILKVTNKDWQPRIVVASHMEMGSKTMASYCARNNTMYINDRILKAQGKGEGVGNGDILHTFVHEHYHWLDAQNYKLKYGEIDSKYFDYNVSDSKKRLDKFTRKGYSVNVSDYSNKMLEFGRYDEVYTEFRTWLILEN